VSQKKAPINVPKLAVPLKTVMIVAAVMLFMLKTVVRYIKRLDKVPMVPSFSNVSFPEMIIHNNHPSLRIE